MRFFVNPYLKYFGFFIHPPFLIWIGCSCSWYGCKQTASISDNRSGLVLAKWSRRLFAKPSWISCSLPFHLPVHLTASVVYHFPDSLKKSTRTIEGSSEYPIISPKYLINDGFNVRGSNFEFPPTLLVLQPGPIHNIDELGKVKGIDPDKLILQNIDIVQIEF